MSKLLHANFARLKQDTFFWIGTVFMIVLGILIPVTQYFEMKKYEWYTATLTNGFFIYVVFMAILSAVFCSLFTGTEYSDGTMRNKLITGHSRIDIYLANLIVSAAAVFILCFAYILAYLCSGIPLFGFFPKESLPVILGFMGCAFVLSVAITAICTAVAMLCQTKANTAVICILGIFILIFFGAYTDSQLGMPEYYDTYFMGDDGEASDAAPIPNPGYLRGTKREVFEFIHDFLPGNQVVQLSAMSATHLWKMSLYSALIAVSSTGLGVCLFWREDIK